MPHDSLPWVRSVNERMQKVLENPVEGEHPNVTLAKAAGIYNPGPELPAWPPAHWESAEDYAKRLKAREEREAKIPLPSLKCDFAACRRPRAWVWYRTAAEIKKGSTKQFKLLPEFGVCEEHKTPWRPWVKVGEARPVEEERVVRPRAKVPAPPPVPAPVVPSPNRKHACPTCTCPVERRA